MMKQVIAGLVVLFVVGCASTSTGPPCGGSQALGSSASRKVSARGAAPSNAMQPTAGNVIGATLLDCTATSNAILDSARLSSGSGARSSTTEAPKSRYMRPIGRRRLDR